MIEVPAAALMLPAFLRHFDFVSIGTNDLIQYTLAIDRADDAVAHLYDPLASGGAAAGRADDRRRHARAARTSASAARWRATRASRELLLGDGPAQLLDAPVADRRRSSSASSRTDARTLGGARSTRARGRRSGARMRRCGEPHRAGRRRSARRSACRSGLRDCAIVAPLVLAAKRRARASGHSRRIEQSETDRGLTGLSKTCQNRGLR